MLKLTAGAFLTTNKTGCEKEQKEIITTKPKTNWRLRGWVGCHLTYLLH